MDFIPAIYGDGYEIKSGKSILISERRSVDAANILIEQI